MIGKVIRGTKFVASQLGLSTRSFISPTFGIGKGFKSMRTGLKAGGLADPRVLRGMGMVSLGMLGTSMMIKMATRQRDRIRTRRDSNRQQFMV